MRRDIKTKTVILLPALLLLTAFLPYGIKTASAADPINKNIVYADVNITDSTPYHIYGTSNATADTPAKTITVADNVTANVTIDNLTINQYNENNTDNHMSAIYVNHNATLNLTLAHGSSNMLTGGEYLPAILVSEGATLTITDQSNAGILYAHGGEAAAGIGTGYSTFHSMIGYTGMGTININAGIITSIGGDGGAGIGTGMANISPVHCGNITISGGDITAIGGSGAAGIGGGTYSHMNGIITISGGWVTVESGDTYDVSIGPGDESIYNDDFSGGTINITGGTIESKDDMIGYYSNVYISGGSIRASGFSDSPQVSSSDTRRVQPNIISLPDDNKARSIEALSLTLNGAAYPYGFSWMIASNKGDICLYLPDTASATAAITTSQGNYPGFYRDSVYRIFKMDQAALSVAGMSAKCLAGNVIAPSFSGGSGSGIVSYTYTGRNGTSYGPSDTVPTALGSYSVTVKKASDNSYNEAASSAFNFSIITPLTVMPVPNQTYTGNPIVPAITVKDGSTTLTKDTDYAVLYSDNTDTGTATIEVTGINDYTGISGSGTFAIVPQSCALTVAPISNLTYSGSELTPAVTVTDANGFTLSNSDYTAVYSNNTDAGTATVTVTGKRNYTTASTGSRTFTINAKSSTLTIAPISIQTYTGSALTPDIIVKDADGLTLDADDYTAVYAANTNAGTATVSVTGKRNYTAAITASRTFTINAKSSALTIVPIGNQTYTGTALTPDITVKDADGLTLDTDDYAAVYSANTSSGTATVNVTGKRNYTAASTGSQTFNITPQTGALSIAAIGDLTYTGSALMPSITVTDAGGLTLDADDYTAVYSANTNAGTAAVSVTGKRNYSSASTGSRSFTIIPKHSALTVSPVANQVFTGGTITPAATVTDADGLTLDSRDYTVSYANNIDAGSASIVVKGCRNYTDTSTTSRSFSILPCAVFSVGPIDNQVYSGVPLTPALTVTNGYGHVMAEYTDYTVSFSGNTIAGTATATITGKGNYTGSASALFTVAPRPIALELTAAGSARARDDMTLTTVITNAVNLPAGTVTLKANDTLIADNVPITLENGVYAARSIWRGVPEGTYTLTAVYVKSANDNYTCAQAAAAPAFSVTKRNQTGFTGGVMNKVFGDSAFTLFASGGQSAGDVKYSVVSGGDCLSLAGDRATIRKAGQAVITATKAGDARYHPATASIIINISKAVSSIKTLPTASAITGSKPLSSSVLTGGQGSVPGTFRWKTPDTAVLSTGHYDIIFTPDDTDNYTPCNAKVSVSVSMAPSVPGTVTDSDSGVEVDISDTVLPDDVTTITIDADRITKPDAPLSGTIGSLLSADGELKDARRYACYTLMLLDQNNAPIPQVNGTFTVKIAVPDGMSQNLRVYRFDEAENELIAVDAAVVDGFIVINTSQVGCFTVVELPEEPLLWVWVVIAAAVLGTGVIMILRFRKRS